MPWVKKKKTKTTKNKSPLIVLGIGIILAIGVISFFVMNNRESEFIPVASSPVSNSTPKLTEEPYINKKSYPVYVPAGDSLSQGYFATTQDNSFPYILAKKLQTLNTESASTISATGVYGGKLSDGLNPKSIEAIAKPKPNLITFEYGTNDAGDNPVPTPITDFQKQIDEWVEKVTANNKPLIVFVTTWNQGPRGDEYDKIIINTAKKYNYPYVYIKDLYMNEKNKGPAGLDTWVGKSDTFHPNNQGHEAIAEAIFQTIKSYKSP